jgi:hypothetical protein
MGIEDLSFSGPEFDAARLGLEYSKEISDKEFIGHSAPNMCSSSPDPEKRHAFWRVHEQAQAVQIVQCAHCRETYFD